LLAAEEKIMKRKWIGAALALLMTSGTGLADECETMATKIGESMNLVVHPRTAANFIPMSPQDKDLWSDDGYGAYLNCAGTYGLNLRSLSPPDPPQQWYDFIVRAGSILTKVTPTIVRDGIRQCVKAASASGYADLTLGGVHISCDVDLKGFNRVDLIIARG
jgi:hypothetical protein